MTTTSIPVPVSKQRPRSSLLRLYLIACIYRIINALLIQTQFDPDEYWQCLEPAYCLAFSSGDGAGSTPHGCAYTWEWTRRFEDTGAMDGDNNINAWFQRALHGPLRSFLPVMPTYSLYVASKWLGLDTTWMISRGPLVLNAIVVAAPTDVATVYIARWLSAGVSGNANTKQPTSTGISTHSVEAFGRSVLELSSIEWWALFASITSWFNGYALVRTYSNSIETMLLTVGIALLAPELFGESMQDECHLRSASAVAFILGGMSVCIRFTSIAAWIPIGLLCCARKTTFRGKVFTLFALCASFGLLGIIFGTALDRLFYGFWAIPFLGSFHFNVLQGNGSLYGTHHPLWYFFAGLPAISGALLPLFLVDAGMSFVEGVCTAGHQARRDLALVIVSYVALHSLSAHKEFRFILPILPLVCVLSAHCLTHYIYCIPRVDQVSIRTSSRISAAWRRYVFGFIALVLLNYPHLLFLAGVHQAGSVRINREIVARISDIEAPGGKGQTYHPEYSIHYLMGCHSTPLYSHLHVEGVRINAGTLDCSPQCRADPDMICESDLLYSDPHSFMNSRYRERSFSPDFLVISEESLTSDVQSKLTNMGMVEVSKVKHEIDAICFANGIPGVTYRHIVLFQSKF